MSLLGNAALAMWWDMAPEAMQDFEHWHAHEHFPERLSIPGFQRGTRWRSANGGDGVFVMYELQAWETLASPHYLARLNSPTPWSARMMPHHRHMVRSQCRVVMSRGGGVARHALTIRLSPAEDGEEQLSAMLESLFDDLYVRPGIVGAHLLQHETPPIAATTEQVIRGSSDQVADWVLVVCGYDLVALRELEHGELSPASLAMSGAKASAVSSVFTVSYSAVPGDVVQTPQLARSTQ